MKKGSIIYRIMLIITERWVLKKIAKLRYCKSKKNEKLSPKKAKKCLIYRRVRGVERDVFYYYLINELTPFRKWKYKFSWVFWILRFLDFYKGGKLIEAVNDIIDNALDKRYLRPFNYCEDEDFDRFKLTKEGYRYISRFYYIRAFYNNRHIQQIISVLIKLLIPILAIWFLTRFFNIDITSK